MTSRKEGVVHCALVFIKVSINLFLLSPPKIPIMMIDFISTTFDLIRINNEKSKSFTQQQIIHDLTNIY